VLHLAAVFGNKAIMKVLLDHGARVNVASRGVGCLFVCTCTMFVGS